jgi:hypothetical protein
MQGEIASVNPEDLRKMWAVFPHMQEQKAGGLTQQDIMAQLTPGADS